MKYLPIVASFSLSLSCSVMASEVSVQVLSVDGKPIENLVVYVKPEFEDTALPKKNTPLIIDQKNKKFVPYLSVMQKGQDIQFDNLDDITHHIYSASGNNVFEFKLQAGGEKIIKAIPSTGEIAMGCNIHDWMNGFVLVVDTPYFAKTNALGNASFSVNKEGRYQVTVWHPQLMVAGNRISQKLDVDHDLSQVKIVLPKSLESMPLQVSEDEFDFLEEY